MRTKTTLAVRLVTRVTRVTHVDSPKTLIHFLQMLNTTLNPETRSSGTQKLVWSRLLYNHLVGVSVSVLLVPDDITGSAYQYYTAGADIC